MQESFVKKLSKYDFDELSKTCKNRREQKRYMAFAHIKDGKSFTEAAQMVRVSVRALMNWVKKFREEGIDSIKDSYGGGPRPHVPPSDYDRFRQAVLNLQKNRSGGRIRGQDVLELIREMYNTEPSLSSVYVTLKKAGLVWITGRSIHPKTDKEAQESFKKTSKVL